jgi:hypothetical protein
MTRRKSPSATAAMRRPFSHFDAVEKSDDVATADISNGLVTKHRKDEPIVNRTAHASCAELAGLAF